MSSVNKVILMGRLGQDPESKTFNGTTVCNFSIATSERYKSGDEWKEDTQWHNIQVWGKRAEVIEKNFGKGDPIYLEGRLKYTEKDKKRYTSVILDSFQFLPGGSKKESTGQQSQQEHEDDMPF